jgi:hypothetical protein
MDDSAAELLHTQMMALETVVDALIMTLVAERRIELNDLLNNLAIAASVAKERGGPDLLDLGPRLDQMRSRIASVVGPLSRTVRAQRRAWAFWRRA